MKSTIAIDYTPAYEQGGGIGRLTRELIAALARLEDDHAYRLFVMGAGRKPLPALPAERFAWRGTRITPKWWARVWGRGDLPLPVEAITGRVDLYHATDFLLPPTLTGTRTLLTVHDLSYVRVPESANPSLRAYLDAVVPRSARRADQVLADSQATKDDLTALYGIPPEKITVILSGVDAHFRPIPDESTQAAVREKYRLGTRPYIFAVGTVQPRKNYIRLMQALDKLRRDGLDVMLVIAGGKGWLDDPIYQSLDALQLREHVHLIGFADDADLPTLYSAAQVTAFPSLYEGFGLPIIESMACGTPVVTSNVSSMPEAAGMAALLIDPLSVDELTGALARLLTDDGLRTDLIQQGYAQASRFTWSRSAQDLLTVYRRLLA
ncbi:MAG TPA: glycosyltransferase family 1 protein [Aggregatilineales bacterium]|nr:glycosyltransferase family 1 protein [Aggregatilineales bacterium]